MKNYITFLKKELMEYIKTYKLVLLIMNPLFAKLTPVLLESLAESGAQISIPDPVANDAWTQFFKNATQMGLIILVIIFSGIIASELSKGTLINLLTKGLKRTAVVLAKYTAMVFSWSISIILCFLVTLGYTKFLFPGDIPRNLLFSVFCLWLFGTFLLSVLLFFAVISKNHYFTMVGTGIVTAACFLLDVIPKAHKVNPLSLASDNMNLVTGQIAGDELYGAIGITAAVILVLVVSSVLIFKKKQI